jgi:hypothetical protein
VVQDLVCDFWKHDERPQRAGLDGLRGSQPKTRT